MKNEHNQEICPACQKPYIKGKNKSGNECNDCEDRCI